MKKIFIVCSVTKATEKERIELEKYTKKLESKGYKVYYPHRDAPHDEMALNINRINSKAVRVSDEVHIFYKGKSRGSHFDIGGLFTLKELHKNKLISFTLRLFGIKNPKVVIVKNQRHVDEKGYTRMLEQWINE